MKRIDENTEPESSVRFRGFSQLSFQESGMKKILYAIWWMAWTVGGTLAAIGLYEITKPLFAALGA